MNTIFTLVADHNGWMDRKEIVESLTGIIEDAFANFDKLENKSLGDPNEIKD